MSQQYPFRIENHSPNRPMRVADTPFIPPAQIMTQGTTSGPTSRTHMFMGPAHKHAHHLHSIPPREKSTRTLIIDHMLWVHGRTRFAQARAELGMTDRTGGPSSSNFAHRRRPENYDEETEVGSDGEDVVLLKARGSGPDNPPNSDDEEYRLSKQDLPLARSLRLRAEGLEKVVTSMLDQPPPIHPINDEDILTPPTSPKVKLSNHRDPHHPHTLPNGVRLRLALGTVINDLFARQAPPPPYRHTHHSSKTSTPTGQSPFSTSTDPSSYLPLALTSLATISAGPIFVSKNQNTGSTYPGYTPAPKIPPPTPSTRVRSLYRAGADPSTANSPPAFRCPRHLHTGCEICVEAKTGARPPGSTARGRQNSYGGGEGSSRGGVGGRGSPAVGGGITGWQDASGIGSGLLRPGVRGSVLRRKVVDPDGEMDGDGVSSTGAGNAKLSQLIPRFVRLSALVAVELGREASEDDEEEEEEEEEEEMQSSTKSQGDEDSEHNWDSRHVGRSHRSTPSLPVSPGFAEPTGGGRSKAYDYALRPSREWYHILAGLLTRAVLEGYLTAGWRGSHAVECLLTVGLGFDGNTNSLSENADIFGDFEPDEMPTLLEATKLLFPALRAHQKDAAEEEYEAEMDGRLRRFYDIPSSTPDLSTHMEDLAWQFPAEPVERAAVRFCEAIAKWRGKPELETYKKKPVPFGAGAAPMTMESLLHSNPTSPTVASTSAMRHSINLGPLPALSTRKPSIEDYFIHPPVNTVGANWSQNKRGRSPNDEGDQGGGSRKRHQETR